MDIFYGIPSRKSGYTKQTSSTSLFAKHLPKYSIETNIQLQRETAMKIICIIRTETDRNVRNRNTIFPLPFDPKDFFSPTFPFPPSYRCIARAFTVAFQPRRRSNSNFEPGPLVARGFARLGNQQPGARGTCACDPHSRSYATETGRGGWRGMEDVDRAEKSRRTKRNEIYLSTCLSLPPSPPSPSSSTALSQQQSWEAWVSDIVERGGDDMRGGKLFGQRWNLNERHGRLLGET